jgi:hypothetical protein
MKVVCPHCDAKLKVDDRFHGRTGPCPRCGGSVLLVPADAAEPIASAAAGPPAPNTEGRAHAGSALGPDVQAPKPPPLRETANPLDGHRAVVGDGPFVLAPSPNAAAYDVHLVKEDPLPALPRAGTIEPPKKSKRAKLREIEEVKREGSAFLLRIRILLIVLGLLMTAFNVYIFMHISEDVAALKSAIRSNPQAHKDLAKAEERLDTFGTAARVECVMYSLLGVGLCITAIFIHIAPVICTWAAIGTYVGAWLLDIALIDAVLGVEYAGRALFSLGTVIKAIVISGLWYGVQVGQAYEEQVLRPLRQLIAEELKATE